MHVHTSSVAFCELRCSARLRSSKVTDRGSQQAVCHIPR
jgi:hypothetical protein